MSTSYIVVKKSICKVDSDKNNDKKRKNTRKYYFLGLVVVRRTGRVPYPSLEVIASSNPIELRKLSPLSASITVCERSTR